MYTPEQARISAENIELEGGGPARSCWRGLAEPANDHLRKFYNVATDAELIQSQEFHIQKLQAKLGQINESTRNHSIREG